MNDTTGKALHFLFVSSDRYPPFRVDVDVLFGHEFARRGHQIDWLLQSEAACPQHTQTDWNGWRVYLGATNLGTRLWHRLHKHLLGLRNDLRLLRLMRDNRYDFVQVKDKFLAALLARWAARRHGTRFVFWLSYPFPEASLYAAEQGTARYPALYRVRGRVFKFLLYRLIAPHADLIVVQSAQMKRDMAAAGVDPALMEPVLMGFQPTDLPTESPTVKPHQMVYLGTLLKHRRIDFLVRVLAKVREREPRATLLIIGPEELPGDAKVLEDEAERLGVRGALTLTGRMARDAAFEQVRESAVAFSPFFPTPILNSTSPTKLVEYLALRKVAVANDHPEQRQVLEDSGGGLCVPYEEQAFADAALELMADPDRCAAMAERGYEYVMAHRTYRVIADQVEAMYRRLLDTTNRCTGE